MTMDGRATVRVREQQSYRGNLQKPRLSSCAEQAELMLAGCKLDELVGPRDRVIDRHLNERILAFDRQAGLLLSLIHI